MKCSFRVQKERALEKSWGRETEKEDGIFSIMSPGETDHRQFTDDSPGIGWRIGGRGEDTSKSRPYTTGHTRSYHFSLGGEKSLRFMPLLRDPCIAILEKWAVKMDRKGRILRTGPWLIFFPLSFLSGRMRPPRATASLPANRPSRGRNSTYPPLLEKPRLSG